MQNPTFHFSIGNNIDTSFGLLILVKFPKKGQAPFFVGDGTLFGRLLSREFLVNFFCSPPTLNRISQCYCCPPVLLCKTDKYTILLLTICFVKCNSNSSTNSCQNSLRNQWHDGPASMGYDTRSCCRRLWKRRLHSWYWS